MTKLTIRLIRTTMVQATAASINKLTPDDAAVLGLRKPLDTIPVSTPPSVTLAALGASGAYSTAFPGYSYGLQLVRNNAFVPFKVTKARVSFASDHGLMKSDKTFWNGVPSYTRIGTQDSTSDIKIGISLAPETASSSTVTPNPPLQELVINGASGSRIIYGETSVQTSSPWGTVYTTVIYPYSATGPGVITRTVDSMGEVNSVWDRVAFAGSRPLTAQPFLPGSFYVFRGSTCEYYEIEVDDALLANITTLATDLFIMVSRGYGFPSPSPVLPSTIPTATATDRGTIASWLQTLDVDGTPVSQQVRGVFVFPLSYIRSQTSGGIPVVYKDVDATDAAAITDSDGNAFAAKTSTIVSVSFAPQADLAMLKPLAI